MNPQLNAGIDADADRLIGIFKDIHQNPELGFMEVRTAGIVAKELQVLGYDVKTGIGKTGVVGILQNGDGPVVMFRADMDCNAVKEATGLPYASTKTMKHKNWEGREEEVPVAHLCGHDAHVTWLLGIARAMAGAKSHWRGTLVLVSQPAEELIMGASAMVRDGMYERGVPKPDYLVGMHTAPVSTGMVSCTPGDIQAGTDRLEVIFHGAGGHGSSPQVIKDPVLMARAAVDEYQSIVGGALDPLHAPVLTVGSVRAGSDNKFIPSAASVKINLRWHDDNDRERMLAAIERVNQSIAKAYILPEALRPTTLMKGGANVLSNDPEMVKAATPVLRSLLGEKSVIGHAPKIMGSEDFPNLVVDNEERRYLYLLVGTAKPEHFEKAQAEGKLVPYFNHSPDYQVDLDAIPLGTKIGVTVLETFLGI